MTRLRLVGAWVGLQLLFFAGWAMREEGRLTSGASILVKVVPVDPRDLLRGQYVRLGYRFSRPWDSTAAKERVPAGQIVWVVLRPEGEFHEPQRVSRSRPSGLGPGEVAIQGRASPFRYEFGVERYFVRERTATPRVEDLTVRLRVDPYGVARIERVYLKGVPWP